MITREAYAFYEAGAAVAAVHLRLKLKRVSIAHARGGTEIAFGRDGCRDRITLWLAGLAAEKKGVGETDPFRRMKNRQRIQVELTDHLDGRGGPRTRREKEARAIHSQAQDRANAVCAALFPAICAVAERLLADEILTGEDVRRIVSDIRDGNGSQ